MENAKNVKINFYDQKGNRIDIRDEDISMGIDLLKNAQNDLMKDMEFDPIVKREMLDSYSRLWIFFISIRAGLKPKGH
jgi:hypothetical protein